MSTPPPLPTRRVRPKKSPPEKVGFFSRFTNALLSWEILRAGRRTGQLALARTVLGGCLLTAMWALWSSKFDTSQSFTGSGTEIGKELGKFAETFAITFFVVQGIAVLLLTPVFVAGAIFEERETRSGEILLTTRLTRREVYVGKVGARIVQVLLVIAAGLPILFLTQLWGGVSAGIIVVCYLAVGLSAIGAGTITAAVSAYAESMRSAILRSYLLIALLDGLLFPASPFLIIAMASGHWIAGAVGFIWYLPLQGGIVIVSYGIGQRWLRLAMLRQKKRLDEGERAPPPLPGQRGPKLATLSETESPLLWKELQANKRVKFGELARNYFNVSDCPPAFERIEIMGFFRWLMLSSHGMAFFLRIVLLLAGIIFGVLLFTESISPHHTIRVCGGLILLWMMSAVGLTAASGIAKERQKHTLIDLLMLPGPRRDILSAKLIGGLAHGILPVTLLSVLIVFVVIGGGLSPLAIPLTLLSAVAVGLLSGTFGVWLSARCRSIVQSNVLFLGSLSVLVIGTYLLAEANMRFNLSNNGAFSMQPDYPEWSRTINPMLMWSRLIFLHGNGMDGYGWGTGDSFIPFTWDTYLAATGGILFSMLLAGLFWVMAVRRFETEGRA
ncbi:ABC transporter permease subunit [Zavarzinella formosa]|uniref:ABC transporter permease subunit n=1 Tax=Zavarzinella formosa TaxID=360055 RepID=UPI0002F07F2F|nr:ABC transporter permease subunit [Zavarzinella formosa]